MISFVFLSDFNYWLFFYSWRLSTFFRSLTFNWITFRSLRFNRVTFRS